jgi:sugar lactone lactonase YvrE
MSNLNPVIASDYPCLLGEGPVWDTEKQRLLWVDILNGNIHQFEPDTGINHIFHTGKLTGAVVLKEQGGLIAALHDGFAEIDLETGLVGDTIRPDDHPEENRFNDGKCDPRGRFWAGTMALAETLGAGSLYTFDADGAVSSKIGGVTISNGMAWTADEKLFYYIDTPTREVVAYDYHAETGLIENKRTVIVIPDGFGEPDGMTIDTEGMLWIAFWDGWKIARFNPFTSELLLKVDLPVARVTCCTFGGQNLDDIYITTASNGLTEDQLSEQPLAGATFVINNSGFTGWPAHRFKV